MKKTKLAALGVAALALVTLSGCATTYTTDEARAEPYSAVQLTKATFTDPASWGWVDSEGEVQDFASCEKDFWAATTTCVNAENTVSFKWRTYKGKPREASVSVGGVSYPMGCSLRQEDTWSSLYVCLKLPRD